MDTMVRMGALPSVGQSGDGGMVRDTQADPVDREALETQVDREVLANLVALENLVGQA